MNEKGIGLDELIDDYVGETNKNVSEFKLKLLDLFRAEYHRMYKNHEQVMGVVPASALMLNIFGKENK